MLPLSLPAPLPPPLARSRLKSNLAALAFSIFARTIFTPYLALRAALVAIVDTVASSPQTGSPLIWWMETVLTTILVINVVEAAWWVQHPSPAAVPSSRGLKFVPTAMSSPLTRSYPPETATPQRATPLAQSIYRPSPAAPGVLSTPTRAAGAIQNSPISSSTAKVFNLSHSGTPSSTGLFYDDESRASPSKVARGGASVSAVGASPAPAVPSQVRGPMGEYVVVDREERDWVDNVWKGVRGKGRHVGL